MESEFSHDFQPLRSKLQQHQQLTIADRTGGKRGTGSTSTGARETAQRTATSFITVVKICFKTPEQP